MKTPSSLSLIALIVTLLYPLHGYAARTVAANAALSATKAPSPSVGSGKLEHHTSLAELAARGDASAQYQLGSQSLAKAKTKNAKQNALVWLTLAATNGSVQGAIEAAKTYEKQGDYAQAARWWFWAGKLGDGGARKRFAELFLKGSTRSIQGREALSWLSERAQANRDPTIKLALGVVLEKGLGVVPNAEEARYWYQDATMDWNMAAMTHLGIMDLERPGAWRVPEKERDRDDKWTGPYLRPLDFAAKDNQDSFDLGQQAVAVRAGVNVDNVLFERPGQIDGAFWLETAAHLGNAEAHAALGQALLDGVSLPMDLARANWHLLAAACHKNTQALLALSTYWKDRNPTRAMAFLDVASSLGAHVPSELKDQLDKKLNAHQLARAKQLSQDWCN